MVGGGNDLLRPSVDLDRLAGAARGGGGADPRTRAPTCSSRRRPTPGTPACSSHCAAGTRVHTANIFTIAQRHGAHVLNLWGMAALRDWRMWAEDRIHLTSEGHRRVALAALTALGHDTDHADWTTPLPPAERATRREELRGHAAWARTHAAPWVQRRVQGRSSGDTVLAKRPRLEHFRDPEGEPHHQTLPDG